MGAGWFEKEHVAFGLPFPPPKERVDRLAESLEVCTRLWADGTASFEGKLFRLQDAPSYPKPLQRPHPPIIIGGKGTKRTPRLAARFADEFNIFDDDSTVFAERKQRVEQACREIGRDPADLRYTWTGPTIVGSDERDLRRRAHRRLDYSGQSDAVDDWITSMRSAGKLIGTVDQVAEQVAALERVGCSRWYFQFIPIDDDGMLELIASELAPRLA
jgi:alkanesulfonate monooxygenase SsuD/methylene tetrahydromethanopterin reductase-like flavin-dependent oxidoreductase (luciferase family)